MPTYNERDNISELLPELLRRIPVAQIFVIDDNSPDGTAEAVRNLCETHPSIRLISRPYKKGLASAYLDAFRQIMTDERIEYVVTMDADYSHDPGDLPKLLEKAVQHDLVVGSRYTAGGRTKNWGIFRRALSRFGNIYARGITGSPIRDLTAGFVVYRRQLLAALLDQGIESTAYGFQIEMKHFALRLQAKFIEVPITFVDRSRGHSKLGKTSIWEGIVVPWNLRLFGASRR